MNGPPAPESPREGAGPIGAGQDADVDVKDRVYALEEARATGVRPTERFSFCILLAAIRAPKSALHRGRGFYPAPSDGADFPFSKRRETMAKRWVAGGIWAILIAVGVWTCGRNATAEQPRTKVEKVTFLGAKHIEPEELQNITGVQSGMWLNPNLNQQGCQKIVAKYEEMGRPSAQCRLVKGGDVNDTEVVYQITEGPKVKVRDIQLTGNTFVSSARLATQIKHSKQRFDRIGGTYSKHMADNDVNELYNYFRGFGYQDVSISLETQRKSDGSEITLIFHIHEGPRYRIQDVPDVHSTETVPREQLMAQSLFKPGDYSEVQEINYRIREIRVAGNERISSESILVHVPLQPGQAISSAADVKRAEKKLAKLGLFVVDDASGVRPTIKVIDVGDDPDEKDLLIIVKEKTTAKTTSAERP
jgi:outer membrane protein assembly factor BamA